MTHYVAIDIGGTNIKYGLIDQEGQLVESHEMPTEAHRGGPHILQKTKDIVASYLEQGPVAGVAISSAGMVDPDKGEIFYAGPQIPNYAGTQFKKEIETSFTIPCEIENDVNCAGLAEAVSGSGKGASVTLCLTIGTGIGGCLIMDGKVSMDLAIQPVKLVICICRMERSKILLYDSLGGVCSSSSWRSS